MPFDRNKSIGGSDAPAILAGNWQELWRLKTKRAQPENLDHVFKVQLGKHTEQFHIDWIAARDNILLLPTATAPIRNPKYPFAHVQVDALGELPGDPSWFAIETKHSSGKRSLHDLAEYYMGQLVHTAAVTETSRVLFSVIQGNDEPETVFVDITPSMIDQLMGMEAEFWALVEADVEPMALHDTSATVKTIAAEMKVGGFRKADMTGSNEWADAAARYFLHKEPAAAFAKAKDDMKALIANDVGEAIGHGIQFKRDKRGALRIKEI